MTNVIRNTPPCLIPKELCKENQIKNYWSVLNNDTHSEYFGTDDWDSFFLIYPKPSEEETSHELSLMLGQFREKYPNLTHAMGLNVNDEGVNILTFKNKEIVYASFFPYNAKEDILYHITNITQQFFDDFFPVDLYYQQIPPQILRLLKDYYELKPL
jgi:hypothetical protein